MNSNEIKVGSEWVANHCNGKVTVKYIGEHKVFIKWSDSSEGERRIDEFLEDFKPKPVERVVWLNIYNGYVLTYPTKEMANSHAYSNRLFCQRVVIKDVIDE